jgi:hypothetical protein
MRLFIGNHLNKTALRSKGKKPPRLVFGVGGPILFRCGFGNPLDFDSCLQ